jgi:predicted glycogen debranching enzyme
MLPNRFPDRREEPEFNSVDASLWYIIAVHEYLQATGSDPSLSGKEVTERLAKTIDAILSGYYAGTRFGIQADTDSLLATGQSGVQLTWMDAKVGDYVVTPRIGKPVEVQALWLNALAIGARFSPRWELIYQSGRNSFVNRFWNESSGHLCDVVDVDHRSGIIDLSMRPNQVFAVGGLPLMLLPLEQAKRVLEAVESELLTPLGLRSLARKEPGYSPHYEGGAWKRDMSYHQGTVWPWLLGPFVEAWIRIRGSTNEAKDAARERFLKPMIQHLNEAGLGHISEIADAEEPFTPRGCPFQAWSLGEFIRLDRVVLK